MRLIPAFNQALVKNIAATIDVLDAILLLEETLDLILGLVRMHQIKPVATWSR